MANLARKLRLHDYFALAFGTMIGTGWLILMDDWLGRGGPLGAILGFVIGGILLLPIGYVYGQWVQRLPDAASEAAYTPARYRLLRPAHPAASAPIGYVYGQWVQRLPDAASEAAYTAQVFPPIVSYFTGWMMLLAYFIVCPWEAVAVGKIAAYILPSLNSLPLYSVAGQPVYLPRLILGIALTLFLATLNYRGIRVSANFQKIMTSTVLLIFVLLAGISGVRGAPANFRPLFHAAPFVSIRLTLQIVPYFLTGFESVPKYAEESKPEFPETNYMKAIGLALGVGAIFYAVSIAAVAYLVPWQSVLGRRFAPAVPFRQGICARRPVEVFLFLAFFV